MRVIVLSILAFGSAFFCACKKRASNPDFIETNPYTYTEPGCRSVFWTDLYCKANIGDLEGTYKSLTVTKTDTITRLHCVNSNFSSVYGDLYIRMKSWTGSVNLPLKHISPDSLKDKQATMKFTDFADHFQSNEGGTLHLKKLSDTRFEAVICSAVFSEISFPAFNGNVSFTCTFDR